MTQLSLPRLLAASALASALSGCAVVSLGASVVGAAVDVTSAVVTTGVKVTGKVAGAAIDAVTPDKAVEAAPVAPAN
jgi:hypothetical protein